jgi:hypothetical protein
MIWRNLLILDRILFWVALALVVLGMLGKIRLERPLVTGRDGRIRLGLSGVGISLVVFLLTWISSLVHLSMQHSGTLLGKDWTDLLALAFAGFLLIALLVEAPATVVIGEDGLEQVFWFGRNRRVQWNKIAEIDSGPKDRTITITAEDGTSITHNVFFSGRSRLLLELKQRCGENLPPDFPREPVEAPE